MFQRSLNVFNRKFWFVLSPECSRTGVPRLFWLEDYFKNGQLKKIYQPKNNYPIAKNSCNMYLWVLLNIARGLNNKGCSFKIKKCIYLSSNYVTLEVV